MFTCENSDYCPNGTETFTSVNDFHAYCKACGFEPVELVGVGVDLWDTYPADHWNAGAAKEIVLRRSLSIVPHSEKHEAAQRRRENEASAAALDAEAAAWEVAYKADADRRNAADAATHERMMGREAP